MEVGTVVVPTCTATSTRTCTGIERVLTCNTPQLSAPLTTSLNTALRVLYNKKSQIQQVIDRNIDTVTLEIHVSTVFGQEYMVSTVNCSHFIHVNVKVHLYSTYSVSL